MTKEEENFIKAAEAVTKAFYDLTGNEDAFNYNRIGEALAAIALGLNWNAGFSGKDATDKNGNPVELKSTTDKNIKAGYTGLSVHENREDFIKYLQDKYPPNTRHIHIRKENGEVVEAYEMNNSDVLNILINRTAKDFTDGKFSVVRKDPRIGVVIAMRDIKKYGEKIELHR